MRGHSGRNLKLVLADKQGWALFISTPDGVGLEWIDNRVERNRKCDGIEGKKSFGGGVG